jgi:hypothetical protein
MKFTKFNVIILSIKNPVKNGLVIFTLYFRLVNKDFFV